MKRREYFLYGNKTKITTLFDGVSVAPFRHTLFSPRHTSASTQGCVVFVDLCSDFNTNSAPLWPIFVLGWSIPLKPLCINNLLSFLSLIIKAHKKSPWAKQNGCCMSMRDCNLITGHDTIFSTGSISLFKSIISRNAFGLLYKSMFIDINYNLWLCTHLTCFLEASFW